MRQLLSRQVQCWLGRPRALPEALHEVLRRCRAYLRDGDRPAADLTDARPQPGSIRRWRRGRASEAADAICTGTSCHWMIHARFSDAAVMKIPRSWNARGLCCCASSRKIAGTSGSHGGVTRAGSLTHSGAVHPSRPERWSASAAKAASISCDPVGSGSRAKTIAPRSSPLRRTVEA